MLHIFRILAFIYDIPFPCRYRLFNREYVFRIFEMKSVPPLERPSPSTTPTTTPQTGTSPHATSGSTGAGTGGSSRCHRPAPRSPGTRCQSSPSTRESLPCSVPSASYWRGVPGGGQLLPGGGLVLLASFVTTRERWSLPDGTGVDSNTAYFRHGGDGDRGHYGFRGQ